MAKHGVRSILIDYQDKQPSAIRFILATSWGDETFALPCNADGVLRVLTKQWQVGQINRRYADRTHAARVAWRIVKDWIEAQLAIVESGQVTFDQVMLPYLEVERGKSLYLSVAERRFVLPSPSRDERE